DLGPEGGAAGGELVAQGTPEAVMAQAGASHTGAVLAEFMAGRSQP
ncbi:MAG: excinuclease ABC subunit A, partial [Anaerolineae bacterium]|nr:excinuclease ABC subunit A [Anaerolineae bacterium]